MKVAIISGIDPSGNAGFIQDVSLLSSLGIQVCGTIGTFTTQSYDEVIDFRFRNIEEIIKDLEYVGDFDVIKVGLADPALIKVLKERFDKTIVWNIILKSTSGKQFIKADDIKNYLSFADYVILNSVEVEELGEKRKNFIVTGGHRGTDKIIVEYDNKYFESEKIDGSFRGTGCVFSSMIAGFLSMKYKIDEAINSSLYFMVYYLKKSQRKVDIQNIAREWLKYDLLQKLEKILPYYLEISEYTVPEVGQNISYALPWAENESDVAKFPGRIRLCRGKGAVISCASFDDSSHTARMTLEMMKKFPHIRTTVNIRYEESYIKKAIEKGYIIKKHNREKEPEEIMKKEGSSLRWGIYNIVNDMEVPPDFIWDDGYWGKEPMIRVFGRNPEEVLNKIKDIIF